MVIEIPKEWKSASGGEEEIDYVFYDLVASAHSGSETLTFFNHNQATSGLAVTNMSLSGALPARHRFLVKKIQLQVDILAAANDAAEELDAAAAEVYVNNKVVFSAPATLFCTSFIPAITTTATVGPAMNVIEFELEKAIVIDGGVPFKIVMLNGKTASSANTDHTFMLRGRLVRPSA